MTGLDSGIDVNELPAVKDLKGSRFRSLVLFVFSGIFGVIPTYIAIGMIINHEEFESPGLLFFLVPFLFLFTLIGLGVFIAGLNGLFTRGTLRITSDEVAFHRKSLFGAEHWTEPLRQYAGVLKMEETRGGGAGARTTTYTVYVLKLHHRDREKRITLYESAAESGLRARWERYASSLNLPAIEETDEGFVSRDVEDLDKSVRELFKEKKIEIDFDPSQPPPKGLGLTVKDGTLIITFKKKRIPLLRLLLLPCIFVGVGVGFLAKGVVMALGILSIILGLIVFGIIALHCLFERELHLSRDEVQRLWIARWWKTWRKRIKASDIEGITVRRNSVVIITDEGETSVADGLSPDGLAWLNDCILTVISS